MASELNRVDEIEGRGNFVEDGAALVAIFKFSWRERIFGLNVDRFRIWKHESES